VIKKPLGREQLKKSRRERKDLDGFVSDLSMLLQEAVNHISDSTSTP